MTRINAPCVKRINFCDGSDFPFANLSAEEIDVVSQIYFPDLDEQKTNSSCLAGYYKINGVCVRYEPPVPPTSGFGNTEQTARLQCSDGTTKTYTTPAGWFRASTQDAANAFALSFASTMVKLICSGYEPSEPVCPAGYTWNPDANACVADPPVPSRECPDGMVWSEDEQKCIAPTPDPVPKVCQAGYAWNESLQQCVIIPPPDPPTCPTGTHWDATTQTCLPDDNTPKTYFSKPVVGTATCASSEAFRYTLPYGAYKSNISVDAATALAQQEANRLASERKVCFDAFPIGPYCLNTSYDTAITATGIGVSLTSNYWSLMSGSLPPGMSGSFGIGGNNLRITGTPTTAGVYTFRVRLITADLDYAYATFQMSVAGHTGSATLTDATFLGAYTVVLTQSGIISDIEWRADSAEHPLPPGLTLSTGGIISGTPTQLGSFDVYITVSGTTALNDTICGRMYTIDVTAVELASVVLEPPQGLNPELLSWNYPDVTASFHEDLGDWPTGEYRFYYVSGGFIHYQQPDTTDIYTHAGSFGGSGAYIGDKVEYSGGLGEVFLYRNGSALCYNVPEVEARESGFYQEFTHAGGTISVTYDLDPAITTAQNVGSNSIWSLRDNTAAGDYRITDKTINAGLPAGNYVLVYDDGAADYESTVEWNTRGVGDTLVKSDKTLIIAVPSKAASSSAAEAETAAAHEYFTFTHPGGALYWRLNNKVRATDVTGNPFPTWRLYAVPPPPP